MHSQKKYFPKKKTHVSFENREREVKVPFIIYVHFESLQVRKNSEILHKPCGFGYSVKCSYSDSLSKYEYYIGEDSPRVLWTKLQEEVFRISHHRVEPRPLNAAEKYYSEKLKNCHVCQKKLNEDRNEFHDPQSGDFLGVTHGGCNGTTPPPQTFVPVVMHNFKKYGSHFLLKELDAVEMKSVFLVGDNQGFQRKFPDSLPARFLDLRQFMDEKIEDLEKILSDSKKTKLRKEFHEKPLFDLIKTKMYFPTYYMDSFKKFEDTALPNKGGFFDELHDESIPQEDYNKSSAIWRALGCSTMRDYFFWYLKSNVCLLEDIFENFRLLCLKEYHLDPAQYYTIASFSWDSMLRYTGVTLELLQDQKMITFIKENIRGGIVQCSKRHSKANNKYCSYDGTKPPSFIVYLDANNLGGWAMSQSLPFSDFKWLSKEEIDDVKGEIASLEEDGAWGYILEVDLEYPLELHEAHNDLPFCSEHLTDYSGKKPALTLNDKKKYVIEYRTLKQCLQHGLVLQRVHRVLKFKQCKWLEPYITYNTTLRAKAKNDFETKLFKLLNNSVYGKTIQRTSTDKPIYAGFSILELSKKFMYDFHYNHMVRAYEDEIDLLYFDTDGAIYEIRTKDYYEDLKSNPELLDMMDTSNLDPRWGILQRNKKVVGKMKEEYDGRIIREFLGVGAKVYFLDVDGEEVKKAVGMKKYVKQKYISRDDYENCVLGEKRISRSCYETCAENHVVKSSKLTKVVLSPGDRKRFVTKDKIKTLAWGMYKIRL